MLNSAQIRGFFEGDGGIQVRVDPTKEGLSFRVQAKFGQNTNNVQILEWVKDSLDSSLTITSYDKTSSSSLVFPFSWEEDSAGFKFIKMYLENKPVNPGTLKDFLIGLIIHKYETNQIIPFSEESSEILRKKSDADRKRIEVLSLLWLRFQRPATRVTEITHPIEYYQDHLKASSEEISQAERFGKELLAPISTEVNKHVFDLQNDKIQISDDFVAYYHVADGGFSFDFNKRELAGGKIKIKIEPRWTITDDLLAKPLLKRIIRQYRFSDYQPTGKNSGQARAKGWKKALEVVIPFFKNRILPDVEITKVQTFIRVCDLHYNKNTLKDANMYRSYIRQAYFLNSETSNRRTEETFERDHTREGGLWKISCLILKKILLKKCKYSFKV